MNYGLRDLNQLQSTCVAGEHGTKTEENGVEKLRRPSLQDRCFRSYAHSQRSKLCQPLFSSGVAHAALPFSWFHNLTNLILAKLISFFDPEKNLRLNEKTSYGIDNITWFGEIRYQVQCSILAIDSLIRPFRIHAVPSRKLDGSGALVLPQIVGETVCRLTIVRSENAGRIVCTKFRVQQRMTTWTEHKL